MNGHFTQKLLSKCTNTYTRLIVLRERYSSWNRNGNLEALIVNKFETYWDFCFNAGDLPRKYHIRPRSHKLTVKNSRSTSQSNFITRMLFKDVYWQHLSHSYIYVTFYYIVYLCICLSSMSFLARDVIYTSRADAMMPVSVCLSVCLWRKCIGAL